MSTDWISDEAVKAAAMAAIRMNAEEFGYCPDTQFGINRERYMREYRAAIAAALPLIEPSHAGAGDAWRDISECPDTDDLFWFRKGNSIDGPRAPNIDDSDNWTHFAECNAPPIAALRANHAELPEVTDEDIDAVAVAIHGVANKAVVNRIAAIQFADTAIAAYRARLMGAKP